MDTATDSSCVWICSRAIGLTWPFSKMVDAIVSDIIISKGGQPGTETGITIQIYLEPNILVVFG